MGLNKCSIETADVLEWASRYNGDPFMAMLCDPPYELSFMGQKWDASGVSFRPETWAALARHLLPGAFGFAFASARGWHRMAVAIEDAGMILHPSIWLWSYAQGFPKATRIDTQVDRQQGVDRTPELVPTKTGNTRPAPGDVSLTYATEGHAGFRDVSQPVSELAQDWAGYRYGLQALKPAAEPIICFQKPYTGRPLDSITQTGAGALNIDGVRIGTAAIRTYGGDKFPNLYGTYAACSESEHIGRWPANLILQHTPDCVRVGTRQSRAITGGSAPHRNQAPMGAFQERELRPCFNYADAKGLETIPDWRCVPECPVRILDEQTGERHGAGYAQPPQEKWVNPDGDWVYGGNVGKGACGARYGDTGSVSRFFYQADWSLDVSEQLDESSPVFYTAKASRRERDAGLDSLSVVDTNKWNSGGIGERRRQPGVGFARNLHPTLKPISLIRHLATLLLPPARYAPRRLLVPFAGSGSECIGAHLAGWEEIVGIEREPEYANIARARLAWWTLQPHPLDTLSEMEDEDRGSADPRQLAMW